MQAGQRTKRARGVLAMQVTTATGNDRKSDAPGKYLELASDPLKLTAGERNCHVDIVILTPSHCGRGYATVRISRRV